MPRGPPAQVKHVIKTPAILTLPEGSKRSTRRIQLKRVSLWPTLAKVDKTAAKAVKADQRAGNYGIVKGG